jgi:type VI secretion system secreted protein VgrG
MAEASREAAQLADSEGSLSKSTVQVSILLEGKPVKWPLNQMELIQKTFDHQTLTLTFSLDIEELTGPESFSRITEYQDTIGKSIAITVSPGDEYVQSSEKLEWVGYVTNVTLSNSGKVLNKIIIEVKSPTFFMDHHKKFKVFLDMNFTDVAKKLLGAASLDVGGVESFDSITRKYQVQWNQTDWEYLTTSYRTGARWIYWDGKKICFAKAASKNDHELRWQQHVGAAAVKMNVAQFETKFEGWDGKAKQDVVSTQTSTTSYTGLAVKAFSASRNKLAGNSVLATDSHPESAGDADFLARARTDAQINQFVTCQAQTNMPSIKVGDTVKFNGLGGSYAGKYFVTEVTHVISNGSDYHNYVSAIPLETANPHWHHQPRARWSDPVPAVVTDNNDPDKLGRVKVKFTFKNEDGTPIESYWAKIASPNAGAKRGFYFLPEIDDEVLVAFEQGDPDHPYVIGFLWNDKDKPPIDDAVANGKVNKRIIYSRSGHQFILGDEDGQEYIKVIDKTGNNTIIIDSKDNTISITADKDYNLTVKGNITLKADGDFKLQAMNVSIDAQQSCKISAGTGGEFTSQTTLKLETQGQLTEGGAMIDISGKGPVTVSGKPIALN